MSDPKKIITIIYRNYRGEVSTRNILPHKLVFENNEWHTKTQWFIEATDMDKGEERTFALNDILSIIGDL